MTGARLAISNIAWSDSDEPAAVEALRAAGIAGLEIAPTRCWPDPAQATVQDARRLRERWRERGFTIVSAQSLLFGRPELTVFESAERRAAMVEYLDHVFALVGALGAGPLVFGSPKQRDPGALPAERVREIALGHFRTLGDRAVRHGVQVAIEANPRDYACNWLTTPGEALEFVAMIDHPGICLHLDAAGMALANVAVAEVELAAATARHYHASRPFLRPLAGSPSEDEAKVPHRAYAGALAAVGYNGWISVEMAATANADPISTLVSAVEFARACYRDVLIPSAQQLAEVPGALVAAPPAAR